MSLGRDVDLTSKEEVKEYLEKLGIEYRFGCYMEKDAKACHLLGNYMEHIDVDVEKAFGIYKKNCDEKNYGLSCHSVAQFKIKNSIEAASKNWEEIYEYFRKACDAGHYRSCYKAGFLALMDKDEPSNPFTRLPKRSQGLRDIGVACQNGNIGDACYRLSTNYLVGKDEKKNLEKAKELSVKACEYKSPPACYNLFLMLKEEKKDSEALEALKKYDSLIRETHNLETSNMEFSKES